MPSCHWKPYYVEASQVGPIDVASTNVVGFCWRGMVVLLREGQDVFSLCRFQGAA